MGVDWKEVRILVMGDPNSPYTPSAAQAANLVSATYNLWNGSAYVPYDDITPGKEGTLRPYDGPWVKVLPGAQGKDVRLLIPFKPTLKTGQVAPEGGGLLGWVGKLLEVLVPPAAAAEPPAYGLQEREAHRQAHQEAIAAKQEWFVSLRVEDADAGLLDPDNVLGQLKDAASGYDLHDLREEGPPPPDGPILNLSFPHPEWKDGKAGDYASDYRPANRGLVAGRWAFEIRTDLSGRPVRLYWSGPSEILSRSRLYDLDTGEDWAADDPAWSAGLPLTLTPAVRHFEWRYSGKPSK